MFLFLDGAYILSHVKLVSGQLVNLGKIVYYDVHLYNIGL